MTNVKKKSIKIKRYKKEERERALKREKKEERERVCEGEDIKATKNLWLRINLEIVRWQSQLVKRIKRKVNKQTRHYSPPSLLKPLKSSPKHPPRHTRPHRVRRENLISSLTYPNPQIPGINFLES